MKIKEGLKKIPKAIGSGFKNKKSRKWIIIGIIAVILAVAAVIFFTSGKKKKENIINTAKATVGNIRVTVSGSGTLQAIESYEVKSTVSGDVLTGDFNEGDKVTKDQILYTIDTTEMQNTIERAELSMRKTRASYDSTMETIENLTVKSPIYGVITNMYVQEGDSVSNGTKICDVMDNSVMLLTIPFNSADTDSLYIGATASVTLDNSFYNTTGEITRISSGSISNENNASITYVDIKVSNPGGIKEGDTATAIVNGVACNSSGSFSCNGKKTVVAEAGGDISHIYNSIGDEIYAGGTILTIDSDSVDTNLENANISLRDAELSLQNTYDRLDDYTIKAPIDGTVIYKNVKAGDTLDTANGATTLCYIADLSSIVFTLSVDELDISKIEVGQKASVTADAVAGFFMGTVTKVSINGTTSNGVTTYPVEITLDDPGALIPGMNVNADIIIEQKDNILMVPASAVMRGNICYVKGEAPADETKDSKMPANIPEGFRMIKVETGVNSEDYVEIVSGLSEGDEVYIRSASGMTNTMMPGRMPGGMGGGMPGGMGGTRMPTGGNMGGTRMPTGGNMGGNRMPSGGMR